VIFYGILAETVMKKPKIYIGALNVKKFNKQIWQLWSVVMFFVKNKSIIFI
jgi:hypothetical protein